MGFITTKIRCLRKQNCASCSIDRRSIRVLVEGPLNIVSRIHGDVRRPFAGVMLTRRSNGNVSARASRHVDDPIHTGSDEFPFRSTVTAVTVGFFCQTCRHELNDRMMRRHGSLGRPTDGQIRRVVGTGPRRTQACRRQRMAPTGDRW